MNWSKLSRPQRIVWLFKHRCTEAHRDQISRALQITPDEFEAAIPRARDIATDHHIWLTPVYERSGWWTGYPTDRILARACVESSERNIGEASRNRSIAQARAEIVGTDTARRIASGVTLVEMAYMGGARSLREQVPEIEVSEDSDYVLDRIDAAAGEDRRFVPILVGEAA